MSLVGQPALEQTTSAEITVETALNALDLGTLALFFLGPRARIVHANRAARALLASGRAFRDEAGRLLVHRSVEQASIEQALAAALHDGERAVLHLTNRQEDINHVVTITPSVPGRLAAVAIAELRAPLLLHRGWSREALNLPAAYAELAEALAGGENLAEFSERTGLTIGGARTRLKKLLRRLGTRSQSDLVALLLHAASALSLRP